ncbi:hypothetical protein ACS0PU_005482 [Formica fusca]
MRTALSGNARKQKRRIAKSLSSHDDDDDNDDDDIVGVRVTRSPGVELGQVRWVGIGEKGRKRKREGGREEGGGEGRKRVTVGAVCAGSSLWKSDPLARVGRERTTGI